MRTKQFKAESKKLLDMMINSIYTHKEIFLRELVSNASDAIDKLYFRSLTDDSIPLSRGDYKIALAVDKENRLLSITDNGCGMTAEELEKNLGTIAKSGSLDFKRENETGEDVEVIGQFGVGFYSAFMVADHVTVESRAWGEETGSRWESSGAEGYTIEPCEMDWRGTRVTLHLKDDTEDEKYSEFLEEYRLSELEKNLGTIAKSGSLDFKRENETGEDVEVIGQFGVGFYSAFMVADHVTVESRAWGEETGSRWESSGAEGYTIEPCEMDWRGTRVTLHLKDDTEDEKYSEFLEEYRLSELVKKYSDYIRYPITLLMPQYRPKAVPEGEEAPEKPEYETVWEETTLNSMIPLWRKQKSEVKPEEYNDFYKNKFYDYEDPAVVIHTRTEGNATFNALLFIPSHAPMNYYSTSYEKGLQLYSRGVLIMEKCADLLPDYFSFVRGLVDSEDLSLNISREMLQHDRQLQLIERALERRIKGELEKLLANEREKYEALWKEFGTQLTYGLCLDYGAHKDTLQDLLLFYSSTEKKLTTLKEYVGRMKEGQEAIYYGCGRTVEAIDALPQADQIKEAGYEMLYMTGQVDEFAIKTLREYDGKKFLNIRTDEIDLSTDEQKKALAEENEAAADLFAAMKEALGEKVHAVRFTDKLKSHPVCLSTEGGLSMEMEQTLNAMPGRENRFKADVVLELNPDHPVTAKLKEYAVTDKEKLADYAKLLYAEGCLIGGVPIEEPAELCRLITGLMEQ